ncbi:hypothetical protein [Nocardia sp. AB354]
MPVGATTSLLVGKLSAPGMRTALAAASRYYGEIRRTIYAARRRPNMQ